jgi:hypothetical protein
MTVDEARTIISSLTPDEAVPVAKVARLMREMPSHGISPAHFADVLDELRLIELVATMDFAQRKAARKRRV